MAHNLIRVALSIRISHTNEETKTNLNHEVYYQESVSAMNLLGFDMTVCLRCAMVACFACLLACLLACFVRC